MFHPTTTFPDKLFCSFSPFLLHSSPWFCLRLLAPCSLAQMPHFWFPRTSSNSHAADIPLPGTAPCPPPPSVSVLSAPLCAWVSPQIHTPESDLHPFPSFCSSFSLSLPVGFEGCLPYLPVPIHSPRKGPSQKLPELFTALKIMHFLTPLHPSPWPLS